MTITNDWQAGIAAGTAGLALRRDASNDFIDGWALGQGLALDGDSLEAVLAVEAGLRVAAAQARGGRHGSP